MVLYLEGGLIRAIQRKELIRLLHESVHGDLTPEEVRF